jgi:hypothetical protein
MGSVGLAFCGLLVLAYCVFKVFTEVQKLASEVDRARRRLGPKQAALREELEALHARE